MKKMKGEDQKIIFPYRIPIFLFFISILIIIAYYQIVNHDFLNLDDPLQLTSNPHVLSGFSWVNTLWSFSPKSPCSPITWFVYTSVFDLFGLNPRIFHGISLFLHVMNSVLLFVILKRMTNEFWKSAIVTVLFAVHPINVESVAWVAELNNVLSCFFFMLVILAYNSYAKRCKWKRYMLALVVFELGMLTKPILMSMPFILLLLDLWPLQRINIKIKKGEGIWLEGVPIRRLILEKIPFLFLSILSVVSTLFKVKAHTSLTSLAYVPISLRIENALVSYIKYLVKVFWPVNLMVLHSYPISIPWWFISVSCSILIILTVFALRNVTRQPYYLVGWLWFIGGLVPFLGLIQGGLWPDMADRYAYINYIGVFIALTWGISNLIKKRFNSYIILTVAVALIITTFTALTWKQVGYWKNSITLYEHILKIDPKNEAAHGNLGTALLDQGDTKGAIYHFLEALKINPNSSKTYFNLGVAYSRQNEKEKALACFSHALVIDPNDWEAINVIGDIYVSMSDIGHAVTYYIKLAKLRQQQGNPGDAINGYKKALMIQPKSVQALYGLSLTYLSIKNYSKALEMLQSIREVQPKDPTIYYDIACVYAKQNMVNEAVSWLGKAVQMGFSNYDLIMTDPDLANIRDTKLMNNILKSVNAKSIIK